jgi:hypothetical protein
MSTLWDRAARTLGGFVDTAVRAYRAEREAECDGTRTVVSNPASASFLPELWQDVMDHEAERLLRCETITRDTDALRERLQQMLGAPTASGPPRK